MKVPTFAEVMSLTETVSQHTILEPVECQAMYDVCCQLSDGATVVEVGCDLGRSTSIILQIAKAKDFLTIHIDPWQCFPERGKQWMELTSERCPYHPFILLRMKTEEAAVFVKWLTPHGIDMVFIDGSHDQPDVEKDLEFVASRIKPGGFLTAHDYPSAGVMEAIDAFVAQNGFEKVNQAYGFGVWRRN